MKKKKEKPKKQIWDDGPFGPVDDFDIDSMELKEPEPPLPLTKENVKDYVIWILNAGKRGQSMDAFLCAMNIRMSDWEIFARDNKKIRRAVADARAFCKGYAQTQVGKLMNDKTVNGQIAKMYLEHVAGWSFKFDELMDKEPPTVIIKLGKTTKELENESADK